MTSQNTLHYLVADIGGTNARFACVGTVQLELHDIKTYSVKEYDTFESAVETYLREHNIQTPVRCLYRHCRSSDQW